MTELGFARTGSDPCVYVKHPGVDLLLTAVYVDDLIIASRNLASINEFKRQISVHFQMNDLGKINQCLGTRICQTPSEIRMDQTTAISDALCSFGMSDCKSVSTPLVPNTIYKPRS
jgi:hypothetical protein